jgi:hypothetical protein
MTGKVLEHNDREVLVGLVMKQVRMLKEMVALEMIVLMVMENVLLIKKLVLVIETAY